MITNELDYSLDDAIVFHDELNPKLWNGVKMHQEVRSALLKIAKDFIESMDLDTVDVKDITVSGSNVAYTYTPHSDIDLHLIADIPNLQNDIYREYFDLKKYEYGNKHKITVKGIDVELYVQLVGDEVASMGVYSVLNNTWLEIPKKVKASINDVTVRDKVDDLVQRAELALKVGDITAIQLVKDNIYQMRRAGLEKGGEFSPENIAFKILRTNGIIDQLRTATSDAKSRELSLEQTDADKLVNEWRLDEKVTMSQLEASEQFINQFWNKLNVDIKLVPPEANAHFHQRLNDARNGREIDIHEITKTFIAAFKKYGDKFKEIPYKIGAVLRSEAGKFNIGLNVQPDPEDRWKDNIVASTFMADSPRTGQLRKGYNQKQYTVEAVQLDELKMSPSYLQRWANSPEAEGMRIGIEFEMCVPNIEGENDDEYEPDYDRDEYAHDIQSIVDFYVNGDFSNMSRYEGQDLVEKKQNEYWDWQSEKISYDLDEDDLRSRIRDEIESDIDFNDSLEKAAEEEGVDIEQARLVDSVRERAEELHQEAIDEVMSDTDGRTYQRIYDRIQEEIVDEMRSDGDYSERDWLEYIGIRTMADAEQEWNLSWPYAISPMRNGDVTMDDLAEDFSVAVMANVNTGNGYHSVKRDDTSWVIEPDGSIEVADKSTDVGLEFISPPMPLKDGLKAIESVKEWAGLFGCYTNSSTGLHMNISLPNYDAEKLDYVKLALFMGDQYILEQFDRLGNTYCKSALSLVARSANPENSKKALMQMKSHLNALASRLIVSKQETRTTSINAKEGWVEFRGPGGDYLDKDTDQLVMTALRLAMSLKIACDETAFKQEYAKKLYKLIGPGEGKITDNTVELFTKYVAGELQKNQLMQYLKTAQTTRKYNKLPPNTLQHWIVFRKGYDAITRDVVAPNPTEALSIAKFLIDAWTNLDNSQFTVKPSMVVATPEEKVKYDKENAPLEGNNLYKVTNKMTGNTVMVDGISEQDVLRRMSQQFGTVPADYTIALSAQG
jgi:hypothetical protein